MFAHTGYQYQQVPYSVQLPLVSSFFLTLCPEFFSTRALPRLGRIVMLGKERATAAKKAKGSVSRVAVHTELPKSKSFGKKKRQKGTPKKTHRCRANVYPQTTS
jgi:hypothetical protein